MKPGNAARPLLLLGWLAGALLISSAQGEPAACKGIKVPLGPMTLAANVDTVHWGYYFQSLKPNLVIASGSTVIVEMITHHAGDDPDKMIKGDKGVESIYAWGAKMGIDARGATGAGDGVHILTGPIYVCGAEPGDVLQVDILDLYPRKNPATGKTYGSNAAAWWGYQFRTPFKTGRKGREITTIYEVVEGKGGAIYAVPDYQFSYGGTDKYQGPKTASCIPAKGVIPGATQTVPWAQKNVFGLGWSVPCVNGSQQFTGYQYPGLLTQHPTGTEDFSIRGKFKVPANLHIGNIGLAPKYKPTRPVDSIPPRPTGGNMDNRRIGRGATMFFPVEVAGALLSMGDAHVSQGDSEFDGTGIETSITGRFKITLHKANKLPKIVKGLNFPLLENANEWHINGFAYPDFLATFDPPGKVYGEGASIDKAFNSTYQLARDWLMRSFDLTEDQAITLITVACDFNIHQVVDGNWGVGVNVPKYVFDKGDTAPYTPKVVCGSSVPVSGSTAPLSLPSGR